jgi:CDP-glucose 4,6-dehydratase
LRALVTGAAGFIGANLAKKLIANGDEVVSILHDDISLTPAHVLGVYDKITWCRGDIKDINGEALIKRILSDYDVRMVYHCAALPIVKMGQRASRPIFEVNTMGTLSVLEALRDVNASAGTKLPEVGLVMLSTDKVYGTMMYGRPYKEEDPLNGLAPYEASKACADLIARTYHAMGFVKKLVVFRPCNQFGPGDFLNYRMIPNVIRNCVRGERPIMFRGMDYTREFGYIDDLTDAFLFARDNMATMAGQAYNIGSGAQLDQNIVITEILKHFPGIEPVMKDPEPYVQIPYQLLDTSKANMLGVKSKWSFAEGISATVKWWKEHPEIWWKHC